MGFVHDGDSSGDSSAGGPLGDTTTVSYNSFTFGGDPELLVVLIEQDNPGTTIALTAPAGWTAVESVDLGHGPAYWLGYKNWTSGDPTSFDWYTTEPAIFATVWMHGATLPVATPVHGQRSVPAAENPIATPTLTDPGYTLGNVYMAAGCRYGQVGSGNGWGLVDETDFASQNTSAGGNAAVTGKSCVLGYTIPGGFGPYHYTPRLAPIITNSQAYTFGAVFFDGAAPAGGWSVGSIRIG